MEQQETLRFGRFEIRRRQSQLWADGKPVELGSRAFDVLLALIDAAGMLVTKSELIERGWPGQAVEENNVQVQIHALRRALGQDRDLIQTVAGRGYRFVGELLGWARIPSRDRARHSPSSCCRSTMCAVIR